MSSWTGFKHTDGQRLTPLLAALCGPSTPTINFAARHPTPVIRKVLDQTFQLVSLPYAKDATARDLQVDGADGARLPARLYEPEGLGPDDAGLLVYLHGGGWVIGSLDSHANLCRFVAKRARCRVLAIGYRKAPEHRFPIAFEDCSAAFRWAVAHAAELGTDPARIAIGGDSAGGNLAAVVAIAARDGNGPAIAGQLLIYPATDFSMAHPSHNEPETSILLTHSVIRWFRDHYLGGAADMHDWRASPARADTLAGLPPAYVLTAGADPLRDEGNEYAERLKQAGVAVTHRTFPGQFHGFFTMGKLLRQANIAASEIGVWLRALN